MAEMLFAYGTLRRGAAAAERLAGAEHMGGACLRGAALHALPGGYPGLVLLNAGEPDRVWGDLWTMDDPDTLLAALDAYEEAGPAFPAPQEYERLRVAVEAGGREWTAWTYIYRWPVAGAERIRGGDWLTHVARGAADRETIGEGAGA